MKFLNRYWTLVLSLLFGLTPLVWFLGKNGGVIINGLDTNFPLDPLIWFERRFFVWNDVANAGTAFTSSTAGIFFHLIQVIPYKFGANLQMTQIISLVFWFSLIVIAARIFAGKIFPGRGVAGLVFVVLYAFNVYIFNTWENIKVANLSLMVSLPLFLSVLIAFENKEISKIKLVFYSTLISLLASGSGINPAYFIALVGGVFIFALVNGSLKAFSIMVGVLLLVNSFWIVPTGRQFFFSSQKISTLNDIGFTNWLDSLSENTSFLNLFRLQGAWDWYAKDDAGASLYIPYAPNFLRRLPFVVFSFVLVGLGLVGLAVRNRGQNRLKIYLGLLLVIGLFFGAGSHPPTGRIYEFLVSSLPFFSFFRSPWYVFTPYVILSLAALVSSHFVSRRKTFGFFALILILGNLIYNYPLVTGKVFRPDRKDSFYVVFPEYVFETRDWLANSSSKGRIIGYPGDNIERFEWGYNSIESFLNLFSDEETLFSPISALDSGVAKMVNIFYESLRRSQIQKAESLAAKLNISTIFVKNDQSSLWDKFPTDLVEYQHKNFGLWTFYNLPEDKFIPKIFSPERLYYGTPGDNLEKVVGFLEAKDVVVSKKDTIVREIEGVRELTGEILLAQNSQVLEYENYLTSPSKQALGFEPKDLSSVTYTIDLPAEGIYQVVMENLLLNEFGVNTTRDLEVVFDGEQEIWSIQNGRDFLLFTPREFTAGIHSIAIKLQNENLLKSGQEVQSLTNRQDKEQYFTYKIDPFDALIPHLIRFDYRNVYGADAIFKIEQKNTQVNYKFSAEKPPFSPEWTSFSFYFDPVPATDTFLEVKPTAPPADNSLGTKLGYDRLEVFKVFTNSMVFLRRSEKQFVSPREITFNKVNPTEYKGQVKSASGPHLIVFQENYSPDWQIELKNRDGTPIKYQPLHFSANMYANVWFISGLDGDYNFEINYSPQKLYKISLGISAGTIVGVTSLYVFEKIKDGKNRKH